MEEECPIWGTPATRDPKNGDGVTCDSLRAGGRYFISRTAISELKHWTDEDKAKLTSWLVEQRRLGIELPKVDSYILEDMRKRPMSSMRARVDNLLRYLEQKNERIGDFVEVVFYNSDRSYKDSPEILAWTESIKITEALALVEECKELKWLYVADYKDKDIDCAFFGARLSVSGYRRLEELEKTNVQSEQAFVAMWFDNTMNDAFKEGIKKGIELAGYRAVRIDGLEHNDKIDDKIIAEIRRSRFLVADFTQEEGNARGGVYYEAGFAHGLNIPVIFTCRGDAIDYVHFDTRQYNHILWEDKKFNVLAKDLADRISATIGDGPLEGVNQTTLNDVQAI